MKTNIIAVTGIGLLVLFVAGFASIFEIRLASAQVDGTSSLPSSIDATTTPSDLVASTSTALIADVASSTPGLGATSNAAASSSPETVASATTASTSTPASSTSAIEPPPNGLTLVHIIGPKYTDYFTDGTTTFAFPGDPAIDSHFDVPNAPIPRHAGLTWDHTDGAYLYDTPSGDLALGDYAVQPNGSYIENAPPFVSSTSTPAEVTTSTTTDMVTNTPSITSATASSSVPDASTTVSVAPDTSASTTSSDSTTSPTL